ncbi:MAG: STAS domain-containing protein [Magnetococcales bacterium]|nr:STAS domain-containing protein [Magnetococcales bacterium]
MDVIERGGKVIITPIGELGYESRKALQNIYNQYEPGTHYILDLKQIDYILSSGLGVLLMLKEHNEAGSQKSRIEIINAKPEVRKILKFAHFDKLFTLF